MAKVASLNDVILFSYDKYEDERGQLSTVWNQKDIPSLFFNHDKVAISYKNVLRGLHTDKSWKLITCLFGKLQLVVVNFNKNSEEYLDHLDIIIDSNSETRTSVLVPPGFLNGHLVMSDNAVFHYKWSYEGNYPDVQDQLSVNWADPKIGIKWLVDNPILSTRDKNTSLL